MKCRPPFKRSKPCIKMCKAHIIEIESAFRGITRLIEKIFKKLIKAGDVDQALYLATANRLFEGAEEGYGKKLTDLDFETPDGKLLLAIRENIFVFSAFKTYQELRTIADLLVDSDGKLRSFSAFKRLALQVHSDYDVRFLNAEYNNAIASAQSAARWQRLQQDKEALPLLQYRTAGDERVRESHQALDNIILPIDDPFWDSYMPPNGWGCRCDTSQISEGKKSDKRKISLPDVPAMFKNNVGKTGVIFPEKHPYFKIAKAHRKKAKNNFGLKIPKPPKQ